ncbi:MAG: hypothetical protein EA403_15845 [Spirochaetaceae bacterium]|nr:MAG: hypothetical protein EA403_15845 [Spirochaetaceae bacterium]
MSAVFDHLPSRLFFPLASVHREHYAALLLIYYRLFLEYHSGVERELVVAAFDDYFRSLAAVPEPDEGGPDPDEPIGAPEPGDTVGTGVEESSESVDTPARVDRGDTRVAASGFLRRLIEYGWMNEEEQQDFARVINISSYATPFFEALYRVEQGISVEYESHVIGIYSSLVGDAARDHGEHAVINAHGHARMLVESLKVLHQNIRRHIQALYDGDPEVHEILHIHYDLYMNEVIDRAYNRLKTSENLSKYRPKILSAVARYLADDGWLGRTAEKLAVIKRLSVSGARDLLRSLLTEIRDELKNLDPLLTQIDDKNRRYSRISTERIKARLYSDATIAGKIKQILAAWAEGIGGAAGPRTLDHGIYRHRRLDAGSLYTRRTRTLDEDAFSIAPLDDFDLERAETELLLRIRNQLSPERVAGFLEPFCPPDGSAVPAHAIVSNMESFVRVIYAAAYAESRDERFPFRVLWYDDEVSSGRFAFRRHDFSRRRTP